jgi:hypothetical protein
MASISKSQEEDSESCVSSKRNNGYGWIHHLKAATAPVVDDDGLSSEVCGRGNEKEVPIQLAAYGISRDCM